MAAGRAEAERRQLTDPNAREHDLGGGDPGEDSPPSNPGPVGADDATLPVLEQQSIVSQLENTLHVAPRLVLPSAEENESRPRERAGAATEPPSLPDAGKRYRIIGEIARGGIGSIYRAEDRDLGRAIAIKVLLEHHRGDAEATRRFVEEAQINGQLQHPGVVPLHEMGLLADNVPYFTMKLVKGRTLAALLGDREGPSRERQRFLGIFEQVSQTLAYAHARGVIHRDLKPSNIMVGAFGEVQVIDWGLAKVLAEGGVADERKAQKTHTQLSVIETIRSHAGGTQSLAGTVLGTPSYMPPEQAHGDVDDLDQRADVFGLGAILCEILTGKPPYTGKTARDVLQKASVAALDDAFARLESCGADGELVHLAKRCLAVEPRDRPRDAGVVAREVADYLSTADQRARAAQVEAAAARVQESQERKRRLLTTALASVVLGAFLVGLGAHFWTERQHQKRIDGTVAAANRAYQETVDLRARAGAARDGRVETWRLAADAAARAVERAGEAALQDPSDPSVTDLRGRAEELRAAILSSLDGARHAAAIAAENRRMRSVLDELRMEQAHDPEPRPLIERYRQAFASYRADRAEFPDDTERLGIEELEPAEVAGRMRRSGIAHALARALDHWAEATRRAGESRPPTRERLLQLAVDVDPHPLRRRIRRVVALDDPAARIEGLRELAFEVERDIVVAARDAGSAFAPLTLELLAASLRDAGDAARAESIHYAAHRLHPDDFWTHHALALILDERDRPAPGLQHVLAMVTTREDSAHAWKDVALAYRKFDDRDAAAGALRQAIRRLPDDPEAHRLLGEVLSTTEDLDGAVDAFREAARLRPLDARAHLRLGRALERRGSDVEAAAAYRKAVDIDPTLTDARARLGEVLLGQGDHDSAVGAFTAVIALEPDRAEAHHGLGRALAAKGLLGEAIAAQKRAIAVDPLLTRAHLELGVLLERAGDLDGAVAAVEKAVGRVRVPDLAPTSSGEAIDRKPALDDAACEKALAILQKSPAPGRPLILARLQMRLGRFRDAESTLRDALERDPRIPGDVVVARRTLGLALRGLGRLEEAITEIDRALEVDAGAATLNARGLVLFEMANHAAAVTHFRRALELDPTHVAARYNMARCHLEQESLDQAITELHAAVDGHRDELRAVHELTLALMRRDRTWEALGACRWALERDPHNPVLLRGVARILLGMGRAGDAIPVLRRAAEDAAPDPVAHAALAEALLERGDEESGDIEGAVQASRKALELDSRTGAAILTLFEALWRQGKHEEATEVLPSSVRSLPSVQSALERSSREGDGEDSFLSSRRLAQLVQAPVTLHPRQGSTVTSAEVVLEVSPFLHSSAFETHRATHWQVRAEGQDYVLDPTLNVLSRNHRNRLTLARGHLLPRTTYYWRAAHVHSGGGRTAFSEESSFTTGDFPLAPVELDLSEHLNVDGVLDPDDAVNDSLQVHTTLLLLVDGFQDQRGLPASRRVGVHLLADYSERNALRLSPNDRDAVRIPIPRGRYACMRYLVTGLGGNSRLPATVEYADGSRDEHAVHCEDFTTDPSERPYASYPGAELEELWTPVWNEMRRYSGRALAGRPDGALFEVVLPLDEEKEAVALVLDPARGEFSRARASFNLFAITGMAVRTP